MELNKFQTPINEETTKILTEESKQELQDLIVNVPYIRNLVSADREYARDRPRDSKGRIIVDIAKPHILEDMDYFTKAADHFRKHGCYTFLRKNGNKNSEYYKWAKEEIRRVFEGYVRESDGEWVTGDLYFFLNYAPMMVNELLEEGGGDVAIRVEDFPRTWEGIYLRFHYIEQARVGGLYNEFKGGNHAVELAKRGCGKSFSLAGIMVKRLIVGERIGVDKRVTTILAAYLKEYLSDKDGTLSKFTPMLDFCRENTPFPNSLLKNATREMSWQMGYIDKETDIKKGSLNTVMGVSVKDQVGKLRGKRGYILIEEFGCHIKGTEVLMHDGSIKKVEDIQLGELLMGDDGTPREVLHCHSGEDMLYKITLSNGDSQIVNSKHLIYFKHFDWNKRQYKDELLTPKEAMSYKDLNKGNYIIKAKDIHFKHKDTPIDPYWLGLWLGDGDKYGPRISNEDPEVIDWIEKYAHKTGLSFNKRYLPQSKKCYCLNISGKLPNGNTFRSTMKNLGILGEKRIPEIYKLNDRETLLKVIAGLIDSDGNYRQRERFFEIIQMKDRKDILDDIKFMCDSLGFKTSMTTKISSAKSKGAGKLYYRLRISGDVEIIPTLIARKQATPHKGNKIRRNWNEYTFKVEEYGRGEYYGFTVDKNHLFVLKDFSIVHNSFPNLLPVYNNIRPGVESGKLVFGLIYCVGTAGDKESDFHAAQELMYYPTGYNVYALPNVYDKIGQGRANFCYFFPAYLNREGCIRENGVSDVTKALIELLHMRDLARYNTSDPSTIIKVMAENPITPQEAILKVRNKIFPTADLDARILEIDNNPSFFNSMYTGELYFDDFGEVQFRPTSALPIRQFPHSDNKMEGSIEMSDLPIKGSDRKVPADRYLMACLKEGEVVNTNTGLKQVENVTLEDKLINIEGEEVEIYNLQKYYNEDPVYKVKLSSIIDSTTFSQEHPIYCCTPKRRYYSYNRVKKERLPERYYEYNFDFRKVSELKVGDVVKSPILYKDEITPPKYNDPDIWYLLGVIIGDGWASKNRSLIGISFNSKELYLMNRCKSIVETKLGKKFTLSKKKKTCYQGNFIDRDLNTYIKKYFGIGAEYKHIDNALKRIPYILRKNFILGYLDTDGNITRNSVNMVSVSKRLLCDIQDWLFSLNIVSSIKLLRKAGTEFIVDRMCNTKDKYSLNIGTEGLNIIKEWGLDSMKVGSYNIVSISNHNRKDVFIKDDYIYLKVKSIDIEEYKGYVYNYECDTHTFMCNYIPTHNCDTYDDDCAETVSLGSVFVMDLWTDKIVAEYTGRPAYADDFYEIVRKLSLFYNARIMYEQNKKGLFSYMSKMNYVHYLLDTPEYLKEQHIIKDIGYGNKKKGITATASVNAFARERIATWLSIPEVSIIKNEAGEEIEVSRPKLYSIWNRALLQELATWNPEYNFDRVSALGMLVLARESIIILTGGKGITPRTSQPKILEDPFFKIYDQKIKNRKP